MAKIFNFGQHKIGRAPRNKSRHIQRSSESFGFASVETKLQHTALCVCLCICVSVRDAFLEAAMNNQTGNTLRQMLATSQ